MLIDSGELVSFAFLLLLSRHATTDQKFSVAIKHGTPFPRISLYCFRMGFGIPSPSAANQCRGGNKTCWDLSTAILFLALLHPPDGLDQLLCLQTASPILDLSSPQPYLKSHQFSARKKMRGKSPKRIPEGDRVFIAVKSPFPNPFWGGAKAAARTRKKESINNSFVVAKTGVPTTNGLTESRHKIPLAISV